MSWYDMSINIVMHNLRHVNIVMHNMRRQVRNKKHNKRNYVKYIYIRKENTIDKKGVKKTWLFDIDREKKKRSKRKKKSSGANSFLFFPN